MAITNFLLLHEAAHIRLGHCALEGQFDSVPDQRFVHSTERTDEELDADRIAASATMIAMDLEARQMFGDDPDVLDMVRRLSLAAILKFVGTTEVARTIGVGHRSPGIEDVGSPAHDRQRIVSVAVGISMVASQDIGWVKQQVRALQGFLDGVERRLEQAVG